MPHVIVSDGQWHTVNVQRYGSTASISLDGGGGRRYSELLDYNGLHQEITIATRNVIAGGDVQQVAPGVTVVDNDFREGKLPNFLHFYFFLFLYSLLYNFICYLSGCLSRFLMNFRGSNFP